MWTWRSPNLTTKNMIDYILTDFPKYFKDVSVLNRLNTGSDHRLVRAKINVRLQEERKKIFQKAIVQKQLDPAAKSKFRIDLRKEFEQQKSDSSTNDINKLNDKLMETLVKNAAPYTVKQCKQRICKFSETTKEMMKKRRQFGVPKTEVEKIEYAEMSKVIKRMQRKDVNNWTARYIEDLAKMGKGLKMAKKTSNTKTTHY